VALNKHGTMNIAVSRKAKRFFVMLICPVGFDYAKALTKWHKILVCDFSIQRKLTVCATTSADLLLFFPILTAVKLESLTAAVLKRVLQIQVAVGYSGSGSK